MQMGRVYSNAVCTVASTGSDSGDGGCFHERNLLSIQPCKVGVDRVGQESRGVIYVGKDDILDFVRNVDRSPLNTRGWVFQERVLSGRILHFGRDMLYWECHRRSASELNPLGYVGAVGNTARKPVQSLESNLHPDERLRELSFAPLFMLQRNNPPPGLDPDNAIIHPMEGESRRNCSKAKQRSWPLIWRYDRGNRPRYYGAPYRRSYNHECPRSTSLEAWSEEDKESGFRASFYGLQGIDFLSQDKMMTGRFNNLWYSIVTPYSRGNLTYPNDKRAALSGIVGAIRSQTGYTYLAGLWKEHLLLNMLWFAAEGPGTRLTEIVPIKLWQKDSMTKVVCIVPTWSWISIQGVIGIEGRPNSSWGVQRLSTILHSRVSSIGTVTTHLSIRAV